MATRTEILTTIKQAREARKGKLDWSYSLVAIPEIEYHALLLANPRLNSRDNDEQLQAWKEFLKSDVSIPYRVARTPAQVRRSSGGIIIK